jgi:hypothetical protein
LSKKGDVSNKGTYLKAQCLLEKCLGFTTEEEEVSQEALDQDLKLFTKPLAPQHLRTVVALFAPDEMEFDEPAYVGFQAFALPEEIRDVRLIQFS